ncbi:MAG: methyl-accepting chemotaxis protein, partial [Pseudomonadota bacterium]
MTIRWKLALLAQGSVALALGIDGHWVGVGLALAALAAVLFAALPPEDAPVAEAEVYGPEAETNLPTPNVQWLPEGENAEVQSAPHSDALVAFFKRLNSGDLTARLSPEDLDCAESANAAITQLQTAVDEALALSDLMSHGDLSTEANGEYSGSLKLLRDALNSVQSGLKEMIQGARKMAQSVEFRAEQSLEVTETLRTQLKRQSDALADFEGAIGVMGQRVSDINTQVSVCLNV